MAKADFSNAFAKFANHEIKTAKIKALDGAEIKYRELTMAETDAFTSRIVKKYATDTTDAEIDFEAAAEIKYEKAALILIEPKMTVEELKALPASASAAITEINGLVEEDSMVDEKGNSES